MLDLRKMIQVYQKEGLAIDLASARVSQDIILLAIASDPLNRNITINVKVKHFFTSCGN